MAKRLFSQFVLNSNKGNLTHNAKVFGTIQKKSYSTVDGVPFKEIQIPVQWGHLAAKVWGSGSERPILALHGWQDNAGTWDALAPSLLKEVNNRPIVAIDLPGHGLSSWNPPGMNYYAWELPKLIMFLKEYFNWDKVSILSHSMGAIAGFRFATVFPDEVDFYIAVDILIYDDYNLDAVVERYPSLIKKSILAQTRLDKEPPAYTHEEVIKAWHLGTKKSVALESVPYLMERGTKPSKKFPDKVYISRDPRLKYNIFIPEQKKFVEALALRLKCPTLYIKAIDSPYATDEFAMATADLIAKNNENFETQYLPGTHHIHLNNPDIVLPVITKFLRKHNFINDNKQMQSKY